MDIIDELEEDDFNELDGDVVNVLSDFSWNQQCERSWSSVIL